MVARPARLWHHECRRQAECAWFPDQARRYLLHRDHGRCRVCGVVVAGVPGIRHSPEKPSAYEPDWRPARGLLRLSAEWEADHMAPLWLVPREFHWWTPWNLQLLCRDCHVAKSRIEAGMRSKVQGMTVRERAEIAIRYRRMWRQRWLGTTGDLR